MQYADLPCRIYQVWVCVCIYKHSLEYLKASLVMTFSSLPISNTQNSQTIKHCDFSYLIIIWIYHGSSWLVTFYKMMLFIE